jgi:hypothetical protein
MFGLDSNYCEISKSCLLLLFLLLDVNLFIEMFSLSLVWIVIIVKLVNLVYCSCYWMLISF